MSLIDWLKNVVAAINAMQCNANLVTVHMPSAVFVFSAMALE